MLIDKVNVTFKAGDGGDGKVSFVKIGRGPDGGNGGKGGDLYVVALSDLTLLNQFSSKTKYEAGNGVDGDKNKMTGKNGADLEILLPIGTSIISKYTGKVILEITTVGQRELLCHGGKGGKGNWEFRSGRMTTPKFAQKGELGEKRGLILNLKFIADFGLIGLPNTGKSSLLNELTNAQAKVAHYPFTTLTPNLGVFNGKVIADIPGLIEGASGGRGLGVSFLKHIEKVGVLLHCISTETKNPATDYETIRKEMGNYNKELLKKPEIILITKSDLADPATLKIRKRRIKTKAQRILTVSIHDWESLEELKNVLLTIRLTTNH